MIPSQIWKTCQFNALRNIHKNIHCNLWPNGSTYQIWGSLHDKQYPHLHAGPSHLARWYLKSSTVTDVFMWGGKEFHRRAPWYLKVWIPYLSVQTLTWSSDIPPRRLYLFSFTSNKSCMKGGLILLTILKISRPIFLSLDMYISGWSILSKSSS